MDCVNNDGDTPKSIILKYRRTIPNDDETLGNLNVKNDANIGTIIFQKMIKPVRS
jgi:hypothetical protein